MRTEKGICNSVDKLGNVGRDFVVYAQTISPTAVMSAADGAGRRGPGAGGEEEGADLLSSHQSIVAVGMPQKGGSEGTSWTTRAVGRCSCLTSIAQSLALALVRPAPSPGVHTRDLCVCGSRVLARGVR